MVAWRIFCVQPTAKWITHFFLSRSPKYGFHVKLGQDIHTSFKKLRLENVVCWCQLFSTGLNELTAFIQVYMYGKLVNGDLESDSIHAVCMI